MKRKATGLVFPTLSEVDWAKMISSAWGSAPWNNPKVVAVEQPYLGRGVVAARSRAAASGRRGLLGDRPAGYPVDGPTGYLRTQGYYGRYTGIVPELKFFDTAISFLVDDTAEIPATGQLSLIPQGDTQSTRNGRKCIVKSIDIHGTANMVPAAGATAAVVVYFYVILDTQCNGAAATVADANTGIFTNANLAIANHTLANGSRFRVLKKWVFAFNSTAGATTAYNNCIVPFAFYKKCEIPLEYDAAATTGAITTIRSNNIFLVAGAANNGQDDTVAVQGVCRLRFQDA